MVQFGTAPPHGSSNASSNVRWPILVLLMAFAGLCHFNRISISVAGAEQIINTYDIDETQMGIVYSSYLLVYTLCMAPGGWFIDRFGPKRALMLLGFGSAVLVPLTGSASVATGASLLALLCVIRGLLGAVNAPMHPAAARAVSFWMPYGARGVANGLVTGAAVIGVASTYFVFGFLMDLAGWPAAFLVAGAATLLLTVIWTAYAADHPSQHAGVNASERQRIEEGDSRRQPSIALDGDAEKQTQDAASPFGLRALLGNRSLVLLTASYATVGYFQYLFFYWMQYYFDHVLALGKAEGRLYATIPTLAMAVGMIGGGWFADRIESLLGGWRGRALAPISGMLASAAFLVLGIWGSQPAWVVTCFALAMGALGASEAAFWVTGIELGGPRGGLSASILNTGGNAGGILAPVITPMFSHYFGWQAGLGLASVLCVLGAALWWWIDPQPDRSPHSPEA